MIERSAGFLACRADTWLDVRVDKPRLLKWSLTALLALTPWIAAGDAHATDDSEPLAAEEAVQERGAEETQEVVSPKKKSSKAKKKSAVKSAKASSKAAKKKRSKAVRTKSSTSRGSSKSKKSSHVASSKKTRKTTSRKSRGVKVERESERVAKADDKEAPSSFALSKPVRAKKRKKQ